MTETTWFSILSQLITGLAWPVTILVLVLTFRKEIRARLNAVREVKYPGGSITMEVNDLAARIEKTQNDKVVDSHELILKATVPVAQGDPQLSMAQMRLTIERELFRLSWLSLKDHDQIKGWSILRHIDELRTANVLPSDLANNLRSFVDISNKILHGTSVQEDVQSRTTVIGATLAAQLHYHAQVRRMEREFQANGIWHMHRHVDENTKKYYWWSAVVASMPEFDFNYEVYREAAERFNRSDIIKEHPSDALYVLSLNEYVKVLEYREKELLRLIDTWHSHKSGDIWESFRHANYWQWPPEWGDLGWKGPIIRDSLSIFSAEDDLVQTRNALNRYHSKLLNSKDDLSGNRIRSTFDPCKENQQSK